MTIKKLILIFFGAIILMAGIFFWVKKIPQQNLVSGQALPAASIQPSPTPSPTPLLNITNQSNLTDEANKLTIPEFKRDYQKLDQSLANF